MKNERECMAVRKIILASLADNHDFVRKIFGNDFYKRSIEDTLRTEEVLEANVTLMKCLYGEEVTGLLLRRDVAALNNLYKPEREMNVEFKSYKKEEIGLVLIRPESYEYIDDYREWIYANGMEIVAEVETTLNFMEYWNMYFAELMDYEARHDFPTRTLNYINHKLMAIIVRKPFVSGDTVSDFLTFKKGKQGIYMQGTLRGEIAYNAFEKFVEDDGRGLVREARIELDPIGMYRKLAREEIESDYAHRCASLPILFYAGQCVHVPNQDELMKHLHILLKDKFYSIL